MKLTVRFFERSKVMFVLGKEAEGGIEYSVEVKEGMNGGLDCAAMEGRMNVLLSWKQPIVTRQLRGLKEGGKEKGRNESREV